MGNLNIGGAGHTGKVSRNPTSSSGAVDKKLNISNGPDTEALKKEVDGLENELNKVFPT
ncbi:MAG: hypothetical protein ACON35_00730 [Candidatus Marinamargulisbacteria bacterium]